MVSQNKPDASDTGSDQPDMPVALGPLGPEVATDDPHGRGDDWDGFRRKVKAKYPGVDITALDPDEVRRWIDGIRRGLKMKGNG